MDAFARTDTRRRRVARATAAILALTALQFGLTMYGPGRQHVDSHGGPTSDAILVDVPVPEPDLSSDTPPPALSPYLSRNARSLPLPARQVILP